MKRSRCFLAGGDEDVPSYSGRRASDTGFPIAVVRPQRITGNRDAMVYEDVRYGCCAYYKRDIRGVGAEMK